MSVLKPRLRLPPHAYVLVALLSLSGCGGGGGGDNGSPPVTPPPTSNPPPTNPPPTNPPPATPRPATAPTGQSGQYLLFQGGNKSLYKYDVDTDALTRLWEAPVSDAMVYALRTSKDGQSLSFGFFSRSTVSGGQFVMASDGSGARSLPAATGVWSPDDSQIAYLEYVRFEDEEHLETLCPEVWVVDRDGNNRRRVSAPVPDVLEEADDIIELKWSPDGRYVSWVLVDLPVWTPEIRNIRYALEIHDTQGASGNRQRILAPPAGARRDPNLIAYEWAPDSSRIAFNADTVDGSRVFTAMADGTNVIPVSLPGAESWMIANFRWSPDSSRLVYLAHTQDVLELYSVAPDGTGLVKLNAPLATGTGVDYSFQWAPDGSRIAYATRGSSFDETPPELYTVRPDGSDRTRLNPPVANNIINLFKWSPDSSRLAYRLGHQFSERKLFIVRADGSDHFEVNGMLAADPRPEGKSTFSPLSQHFDWSPDSTHLFHVAENGTAGSPAELFTLRADTKDYAKLNDPPPASVSLEFAAFVWSKDGSRAVYLVDDDGDGTRDLFLVAPNGAAYKNISKSFGLLGAEEGFRWSP